MKTHAKTITALAVALLLLFFALLVFFSDMTIYGRRFEYSRLKELAQSAKSNPNDPKPVQELIRAMQSGSSHQRTSAAKFLGSLGPQAAPALTPLIEAATGRDLYLSAEATRAIGAIGPKAKVAVPILIKLAKDHPTDSTGYAAIKALGRTADVNDESALAVLHAVDKNDDAHYAARVSLATLRYRRLHPDEENLPQILPEQASTQSTDPQMPGQ